MAPRFPSGSPQGQAEWESAREHNGIAREQGAVVGHNGHFEILVHHANRLAFKTIAGAKIHDPFGTFLNNSLPGQWKHTSEFLFRKADHVPHPFPKAPDSESAGSTLPL
jgi:hypothetical protein